MKNTDYFMATNNLIDSGDTDDLSHLEFRVLIALLRYSNSGKDTCYPSFSTLAKKCCASEKGVRLAIKVLCEKGFIKQLSQGSNLKGVSNVYQTAPLGVPFVTAKKSTDTPTHANDSDGNTPQPQLTQEELEALDKEAAQELQVMEDVEESDTTLFTDVQQEPTEVAAQALTLEALYALAKQKEPNGNLAFQGSPKAMNDYILLESSFEEDIYQENLLKYWNQLQAA